MVFCCLVAKYVGGCSKGLIGCVKACSKQGFHNNVYQLLSLLLSQVGEPGETPTAERRGPARAARQRRAPSDDEVPVLFVCGKQFFSAEKSFSFLLTSSLALCNHWFSILL